MAFRNEGGGWQWTRLASPAAPDGWTLHEVELGVAAGDGADAVIGGCTLTGLSRDRAAFEAEAADSGLRILREFSFGPAANVVRIETWVRSLAGPRLRNRIGLLALGVEGESFRTTGPSPASLSAAATSASSLKPLSVTPRSIRSVMSFSTDSLTPVTIRRIFMPPASNRPIRSRQG